MKEREKDERKGIGTTMVAHHFEIFPTQDEWSS